MARDGFSARQITKTQAAAASTTMAFSFGFAADLPGVTKFEVRHITVSCEDSAPPGTNWTNPVGMIITQGAKKFVFQTDRYNAGPLGFLFPDGLDLDAADGDTVSIAINCGSATNNVIRHCFIRGLVKKY